MIIDIVNKNSIGYAYDHATVPNLKKSLKDTKLVLAFDQSTTCTGLTIGTVDGIELLFGSFTRDNKVEKDFMDYKNTFKEALYSMFSGCNIDTILHEDTFSEGYTNTDKVLSTMKTAFREFKYQYNLTCDIIEVKQQIWKTCFLLDGFKQQTKENVAIAANHYMPNLFAVQDIYDSLGIFHYYKTQILPSKNSPVFIPYKGMKIDKRHGLSIRVVQTNNIHELSLNQKEKVQASKYGINRFQYNDKKWIEENCRMLTSHSNKVWVAEIDNTNRGMYVNAIWCNYDIIPEDDAKLYCIAYRLNKTSNATLDKN